MIKKILKICVPIIFLFFIISAAPMLAATQEYIPLEKDAFAGISSPTPTGNPLVDFLTSVFNFGIAAAVVLALIMIIWGGIIKMTTDSWQGQDEAKSKFENAGYGLGLALLSYLILYTINPCLVYFGDKSKCNNQLLFAPPPQTIVSGGGAGGNTVSARSVYPNSGLLPSIDIHSTDGCYDINNRNCTSLQGMPQSVFDGLNAAAVRCQGCITITGGTETGHLAHGANLPVVDISYSPDALAALSGTRLNESVNYQGTNNYTCEVNVTNQQVPCANPGRNDIHIHIQY